MTNPEHWNSLASLLGAEIPSESPAAENTPAAKPVVPPARTARPPEAKKTAPPPKTTTDWSQLAGALGLAPTESAPPQTTPDVSTRRQAPELRPRTPPRETPGARQPPERVSEERFESFEGIDELDEEPIDAELVEEPEPQDATPSGDEEERTGRKRRRRRRGGRRSRRDRPAGDEEERPPAGDTLGAADSNEAGLSEESAAEEEGGAPAQVSSEEPDRKGRPRRRRRRGSGRERDAPRGKREENALAAAPQDNLPDEETLDQDDFESTSGEDLSDNDDGLDEPADKNSHRAIPAWEEAIGFIVSVNMEARAKNPKSAAPRGRGRGRGRGNSRGAPRRS